MNKEELYQYTDEEKKENENSSICIPANFQSLLDKSGQEYSDTQIANLLAIQLGSIETWDSSKVNELARIFIKYKVKENLIDTKDARNEQKKFKEALIKQANILLPTPKGIKESSEGYVLWTSTKDGRAVPKLLTNFLFQNIRTVQISLEEKALLVDIQKGKQIAQKIVLKAEEITDRRLLHKRLKDRIMDARIITTKTEEVDELMTFVAEQAQGSVKIEDYTGLFHQKESGQYYFVINDGNGSHSYIKPPTMKINDSDLVQIKGRRNLSSHTNVSNVLSDDSWYNAATELLSIVPASLKDSKSLLMLSWFFASLISSWMFEELKLKLPILFIYGEPGSGKSTNLNLITTFFGNTNNTDISMSSTNQPIRDAMSSTNAFPVLTTEYNDKAPNIMSIINMLKILYDRSFYERGQLGHNDSYRLQAPWIMQGNMRVNNLAVQDRMLQIRIQKTDRSLDGKQINKVLMRKLENKRFIGGYLPYLIERQDQWNSWHEEALSYVPEDIDARQLDITTTIVIGLIMIQDLRNYLGMSSYTSSEIGQVVGEITESRVQNQIQPQHIQFLEYLQTYHTDPDIYAKRVNGVSPTYGFMFNQAWWLNKYQDFCKGKGNDFDKNVILDGLKSLGVITNKTISIRGNNTKCIAFSAQELEEATRGIIEGSAWVKNPVEIIVEFNPEEEIDTNQHKITLN